MESDMSVSKFPTWLTTVTPLSKALAAFLFVTLPIVGFLIGLNYRTVETPYSIPDSNPTPSPSSELTVTGIRYLESCLVEVTLSTGSIVTIDPKLPVRDCSQVIQPVISSNGKYAAFDLWSDGGNALYVYFASLQDWASVYPYGAAAAGDIKFLSDDSIVLLLKYPEMDGYWRIPIAAMEREFSSLVDPASHQLLRVTDTTRVGPVDSNGIPITSN